MTSLSFVLLGLVVGILSGMVGVGGGIILVPVLVYVYGYSQHMAQGTSTAMLLPPIGILAAYTYYKHGYVNIPAAALLCLGFVLGGYFGARLAVAVPDLSLKRGFGVVMLLISMRMIFGK